MADAFSDVIQVDIASDTAEAEKCRKALEAIAVKAFNLDDALRQGTVSWDKYNQEMARLGAQASKVNAAFDAATSGIGKIGPSAAASSQKLISMGRLFDDLQYVPQQGLRPIINNVMELSPAIGIALIAVQTLGSNFHYLTDAFGSGAVKTQAEEMEELGKQTRLTADEYDRLGRFQRGEKAVKDLRDARPEAEKKADQATLKAIGEAGGDQAMIAGLLRTRPDLVAAQGNVAPAQAKVDESRAYIAAREKRLADPELIDEATRDRLRAELADAREILTGRLKDLADASKGTAEAIAAGAGNSRDNPGARKQLADAIRRDPAAFGPKGAELLADLDAIDRGEDPAENRKKAADEKAKKAKDDDQDFQRQIHEAETAANKKSADFDRRAGELAAPLQKRFNRLAAGGGGADAISPEEIAGELAAGGATEAEAAKFARTVYEKLQAEYNEAIRKKAGELGTDAAGAADAILAEGEDADDRAGRRKTPEDRRRADLDAQVDKARRGAEAAERDRAAQFEEATKGTGRDAQTRNALLRGQFSADPAAAAARLAESITKQLVAGGMDAKAARLAAEEHIEEQKAKLGDDVREAALRGPNPRDLKAPERIGISDFARSVESAGADYAKQSVDLEKQMVEHLATIARGRTGRATF